MNPKQKSVRARVTPLKSMLASKEKWLPIFFTMAVPKIMPHPLPSKACCPCLGSLFIFRLIL